MSRRVLFLLLILLPAVCAADESPVGVKAVTTPDLSLFYYDSLGYLEPHAVRTFTNALAWQRRMFGWTPSDVTILLLEDRTDYGNAATYVAPKDTLVFEVAPLSLAFETYPASERMLTLMNHELVHVAQGDASSSEDRRWRRFFLGKVSAYSQFPETLLYTYLTVPRSVIPRWTAEGEAVFVETWMGGGLGRAQGGYDEMVFRAMVRDGAHFYDPLGLVSRGVQVDFQVMANAYLYGTRFMTWLAYAYSPSKVLQWIRRDEGSKRYYADQFEHVFGLPLDRAWQDWIAFEHEFQERNLAKVRKFPITPHRDLVAHPLGSVSRTYYDEKTGMLYGGFKYPGVVEYVGAINTRDGSVRPLADIKRAMFYKVTSFAYDPSGSTAFFTNDNRGDNSYRDLMAVDIRTGEQRMLMENVRIGEIVVNPVDKALIGVRHSNGIATLVRIPPPYDRWFGVHEFPYGMVPYDLDVSPDGRLLSGSVAEIGGDQFLRVWDLQRVLNGDMRPLSEYHFGQSVPESFTFSHDGRYLYGSSYYTGVSNIFRYEVATGAIEAVSNAETGFFRPLPLTDGRLIVLNYTAAGFVPAIIDPRPLSDVGAIRFLGTELVDKYPELKTWQVASPSTVDDEKLITSRRAYHPLQALSLVNAFPTLQGYKNSVGFGYHANFLDPIQYAGVGLTAAFTPDSKLPGNERAHIDLSGHYLGGWGSLSWNKSDFYDLFGPTKRSRKGFAAKVGYDRELIYDEPRFFNAIYELDYFDKIDTLPGAQNVGTPFTRLLTAKVGLLYTNKRQSLGAVDDEKGIGWSLFVLGNHVSSETAVQAYGTFDYGFALPIPNSSVWLRSAAGVSSGKRDNPVANFYLGAFGNNYVDHGDIKRYRNYDSMPGFKIDELSGQSFARQMVEWNLPPVVFESVGTPALYLNWLRPSVFASALWTDPGRATRRNDYQSLGTQCDLRISVLHRYEMTLSAGYAVGLKGGRRNGDEWMISLKIL